MFCFRISIPDRNPLISSKPHFKPAMQNILLKWARLPQPAARWRHPVSASKTDWRMTRNPRPLPEKTSADCVRAPYSRLDKKNCSMLHGENSTRHHITSGSVWKRTRHVYTRVRFTLARRCRLLSLSAALKGQSNKSLFFFFICTVIIIITLI